MSGNEDEGSAHSLHDGDKVDRFVIEGRLGAGGMGEVYRAFDPKLVRRVALKRLREGPMSDEARAEFTARMIRQRLQTKVRSLLLHSVEVPDFQSRYSQRQRAKPEAD